MKASLLAVVAATVIGCAGVSGDPDTIVVDGTSLAGFAWSGPGMYCCSYDDGTVNVGWQIWFTNTEYCPTSIDDFIAGLYIVGSERVYPPSTALPVLASSTLPVARYATDAVVTEPVAYLSGAGFDGVSGTVTVTRYGEEQIAGHFEIQAERIDARDPEADVHGTFVARRCSRLHN